MDQSACGESQKQQQKSPSSVGRSVPPTDCILSDSTNSASGRGSSSSSSESSMGVAAFDEEAATTTATATKQEVLEDDRELAAPACDDESGSDAGGESTSFQLDNNQPPPGLSNQAPDNQTQHSRSEQSNQQQRQQQQQQQQHWHHRHKEFQQRDLDDVKQVELFGVRIVALTINGKDRLCLAQISNTLLKEFSYNEIHNRRVALGITCIQCTPIQLEMLRRAGAMPSSSRRCGMITMREAERLCRSFLVEEQPPELPENFYFTVAHRVNYGCRGRFVPARYISSRAKCIECFYCGEFYSPNKFIFHSHRQPNNTDCNPPDSPNINSWRKHIDLDWTQEQGQEIRYAWEDVKSLFNGGTRRRAQPPPGGSSMQHSAAAAKAPVAVASIGQRKSATTVAGLGRFSAVEPAVAVSAAGDEDHIDVVCDELEPAPGSVSSLPAIEQQQQRNSRGSLIQSRHNRGDELAAKPRTTATSMHQQQRISGANKRPLGSGSGGLMLMQPHNKRSTAQHHYRHQSSSILGDSPQITAAMKVPATLESQHGGSRLSEAPFSVNQAGTNQLRTGGQFNDIDFSGGSSGNSISATTSRRSASNGNHRMDKSIDQYHSGGGSGSNSGNLGNPLMMAPEANFIHGQLYSQLMQQQPHQQQLPQLQALPEAIDAQVALRHHLWTSLLANLQCNFATNNHNNQIYSTIAQQQQQQVMGAAAAAAAARMSDIGGANNARSSIDHLLASAYPQVAAAKLISNPQTEMNLNNYTT